MISLSLFRPSFLEAKLVWDLVSSFEAREEESGLRSGGRDDKCDDVKRQRCYMDR